MTSSVRCGRAESEPIKMIDLSGSNEAAELLDQRAMLKDGVKSAEARCEAMEIPNQIRDERRWHRHRPGWLAHHLQDQPRQGLYGARARPACAADI